MIFRSQLAVQESRGAVLPAFEAIAETQRKAALTGWYVTQPDHACISGKLAAALDSRKVPNLGEAVVRAISLHDLGWMPYDGDVSSPRPPTALASGVPLSFANTEPEQFLCAWMGSIQAAQSTGPLGGLLVSAHFARLAQFYLERSAGTPEQRAQAEGFRQREAARVERLLPQAGLPMQEIEALIAVLKFATLPRSTCAQIPQLPWSCRRCSTAAACCSHSSRALSA